MKKLLSLCLAAVLCLSMAACGPDSEETVPADSTAPQLQTEPATEAVTEPAPTIPLKGRPAIRETVVVDEQGILVTALGLACDGRRYELQLLAENNTDQDLSLRISAPSVNGYLLDDDIPHSVHPGENAVLTVSVGMLEMDLFGLDPITDFEFLVDVYDDTMERIYRSPVIHLDTSAADGSRTPAPDYGTLLLEEPDLKIVSLDRVSGKYGLFGPSALLYVENNGTDTIYLNECDAQINGIPVKTYSVGGTVTPGKRLIYTVIFSPEAVQAAGITTWDTVTFRLALQRNDSDFTDFQETASEPMTIHITRQD